MKATLTALALALTLAATAHNATAATDAPLTPGIVKKIDKASGKLTLSHGPLPNGMPAMTMAFKVKDAARLDGLKEGQKMLFAIDDSLTIVRLEPARQP